MSATTIPDTNLPIFLQNFVITYDDATGDAIYSTVSINPTNNKLARAWNIVHQAILQPGVQTFRFTYDFTGVVLPPNFYITFKGPIQGTGYIGRSCRSLNLQRQMTYAYDFSARKLVFTLEVPKPLKKEQYVWLDMYIDDGTRSISDGIYQITMTTPNGTKYWLANGRIYDIINNKYYFVVTACQNDCKSSISTTFWNITFDTTNVAYKIQANINTNLYMYMGSGPPAPALQSTSSYWNIIFNGIGQYQIVNTDNNPPESELIMAGTDEANLLPGGFKGCPSNTWQCLWELTYVTALS